MTLVMIKQKVIIARFVTLLIRPVPKLLSQNNVTLMAYVSQTLSYQHQKHLHVSI
jgi:hypothetical protein